MKIVVFGQAIVHAPVTWTEEIRALADGADAVICNFEGCLPPPGVWPMKAKTVHAAHPEALAMLRDLGVTHLGIANNHAWDFGHAGVNETRRRAVEAGFAVAGAGSSEGEAWQPAARNGVALIAVDAGPTPDWAIAGDHPGVAGLRLRRRLRLLPGDIRRLEECDADTGGAERRRRRREAGYDRAEDPAGPFGLDLESAPVRAEVFRPDAGDLERLCGAIEEAGRANDCVIVGVHFHHWSPDWVSPPDWLVAIAGALERAGADAVCGTGPPFALPAPRTGPTLCAPSLGNLVFHTRRGETYDRLGLPVWQGLAAIRAAGAWSTATFAVPRS